MCFVFGCFLLFARQRDLGGGVNFIGLPHRNGEFPLCLCLASESVASLAWAFVPEKLVGVTSKRHGANERGAMFAPPRPGKVAAWMSCHGPERVRLAQDALASTSRASSTRRWFDTARCTGVSPGCRMDQPLRCAVPRNIEPGSPPRPRNIEGSAVAWRFWRLRSCWRRTAACRHCSNGNKQ